ncbi:MULTISPECIES: hypothetical protein [Enterobacteriaceae]|uniref:hypothetical protein n=1 Tax=Enterobacteriaceae TaxID=543 RepID=UPI002874CF34|nr:hypothetical protein [Citrobacter freundii]MDS0962501.1 hypothetical protein [Citrobacter freundii]
MKRRTRIYYTPEQKAIIWDRYKQGDSLRDITDAGTASPYRNEELACCLRPFWQKP